VNMPTINIQEICQDLRAIGHAKRTLNMGVYTPFFHAMMQRAGELEGILTDGFETPLRQMLYQGNWNTALLKHELDADRTLYFTEAPRLCVRGDYDDTQYVIRTFPVSDKGTMVYQPVSENSELNTDFIRWDPHTMGRLITVKELPRFARQALSSGDAADKALLVFIHNRVVDVLSHVHAHFRVLQFSGPTVEGMARRIRQESADAREKQYYAHARRGTVGLRAG
jgi:hypothetical protein